MLHIYIDADACPVKVETCKVARRYDLNVTLVSNTWMRIPGDDNIKLMIVEGDVYTVPIEQLTEQAVKDLDRVRHQKYELRTGRQQGRLRPIRQSTRPTYARQLSRGRYGRHGRGISP